MMTPKLIPVDLTKRENCEHPDIKMGVFYLVQYNGKFAAGRFEKQWYGWNLDAVYDAGVQLDDKSIQALWEIIPGKKLINLRRKVANRRSTGGDKV